jgi:hypothetical protein
MHITVLRGISHPSGRRQSSGVRKGQRAPFIESRRSKMLMADDGGRRGGGKRGGGKGSKGGKSGPTPPPGKGGKGGPTPPPGNC